MIKFILGLILGFTMTVMYYSSKEEEYRKENIMDLDEEELEATRKMHGLDDKSKEEKEKENKENVKV